MIFSADIAPKGPNFIYIVESHIDFSNEEVGDIDPLLLDVNDDGDNDGVDDNDEDDHDGVGDNDEDDHDGVGDNANESNDDNDADNVSVSSEQSDISLASTVLLEDVFIQEFLEDSTGDYCRENWVFYIFALSESAYQQYLEWAVLLLFEFSLRC